MGEVRKGEDHLEQDDMAYRNLVFTKKDNVAYFSLNRPGAGNAINQALADELGQLCQQVNEDDEIRVVVITGSGEAFSLGGEVAELQKPLPSAIASRAVASLNAPAIAAINGDALGAGLELALACDIRLAVERARFGFPEISDGVIPGGGGTQRLPRIVGRGKALEMLLTAEAMDAEEAYRIGLINRVISFDELHAAADKLARKLASKGPIAIKYAKEAINKGLDMALEQGLRLEADLSIILQSTEDRDEGIRAFLEKQVSQFKGR